MSEKTRDRLTLLHNGYHPLPLVGKNPNINGKDWQLKRLASNAAEIELWRTLWPDAGNTGLLCKFTPFLDLDILDEEAAEACTLLVYERWEDIPCRVGLSPKRGHPFRTATPFGKITVDLTAPNGKTHRIEFLADGQQFVAFGIHPDTNKPYTWHGGSPLTIPHNQLPSITEAEAQKLVDDLVALLEHDYGYKRKETPKEQRQQTGNGGDNWHAYLAELISHDSDAAFAMALIASGMDAGAAVNFGRALIERYAERSDGERLTRRLDEWPAMVRSARNKIDQPPTSAFSWDSIDLDGLAVPEPQYVVHNRIPAGQVTLFTGHGGTGKSTIGLQLAAAHALGRDWLGSVPLPGPAWFIDAEDPFTIIHFRLDKILRFYNAAFTDLLNGGLHLAARSGKQTLLAVRDSRSSIVRPTQLYLELIEQAKILKPVNIIIASLACVFAGNENDRSDVQQFINLLKAFTNITGGAVTLIAHPSKTALADGNGYSGSTTWFNATRAQINLSATDETGLRKLAFLKNQYGGDEQPLTLRWHEGVFVPEATGEATYEKAAREHKAEQTFLTLLQTFLTQGRNLSHKPTSPNFAPKAMASQANGVAQKDLASAMERLFAAGKIKVAAYGYASRGWERIEAI